MSSRYPYLDITVNVANAGQPVTVYGTAGASPVELPAIGPIVSHFENLTDGYLLWMSDDRRGYSYFVLNGAGNVPAVVVTILVDRDVLLSGRAVVSLLSAVKNRALDNDPLEDPLFDRLISEAGFSEEPLRCECDESELSGSEIGCRYYSSPGELSNIIGFPRQKSYVPYLAVVIVPSSEQMISGDELPLVATPVDKALMVVCPEGVSASSRRVGFSDKLTVTYRCDGFDPVSVAFEVGTTNRYVRINGSALLVNSAGHAGIVFRRRIPYTVTTIGGTSVDTYTILINGRTANRTEEGFEVANTDFEKGVVKITVSSTNFSTYNNTFTPETLEAAAPLAIELEPESRSILLRLDFGDGRVVEENLNIEKNTPEYCQLRAGRFHGFRAHRLMGSSPETYNIDVRPSASAVRSVAVEEPTLPLELPSDSGDDVAEGTIAERQPTRVVPVIEKAPTAIHHEKKKERRAPQFVNETQNETPRNDNRSNMRRLLTYGIGAVVVILAIWYIAGLISGSGSSSASQAAGDSTVTASQAAVQTGPVLSTDEQADIDYLNSNPVWVKSELKTEKYKALIDAFMSGDIDAIANHEYFAVKNRATNRRALELIDNLWKAKGSSPGKRHPGVLKNYNYSKGVNLYEINNNIAILIPPKEEYNQAPRPQN